jgi:hypothetical protein
MSTQVSDTGESGTPGAIPSSVQPRCGRVGLAPSGLELAGGAAFIGEDAWESARCLSPTEARSPFA